MCEEPLVSFKRKGQRGDPDTIPSAGTNQSLRRSKPRSSAKCPRSQIKSAMDARRLCRNRVGCPGNVFGFVDHAYNPKPRSDIRARVEVQPEQLKPSQEIDDRSLAQGPAVCVRYFGWQVGEAGNSHAMREPPVDRSLDEIGREEGKRECHIHLADAAPLSLGDAFRGWLVAALTTLLATAALHELAFRPDAVEHLKQQRTQ